MSFFWFATPPAPLSKPWNAYKEERRLQGLTRDALLKTEGLNLMAIDKFNMHLVAVKGDDIVIMNPRVRMTKADALNLAAWLVALSDDNEEFNNLLARVLDS